MFPYEDPTGTGFLHSSALVTYWPSARHVRYASIQHARCAPRFGCRHAAFLTRRSHPKICAVWSSPVAIENEAVLAIESHGRRSMSSRQPRCGCPSNQNGLNSTANSSGTVLAPFAAVENARARSAGFDGRSTDVGSRGRSVNAAAVGVRAALRAGTVAVLSRHRRRSRRLNSRLSTSSRARVEYHGGDSKRDQ